MERKRLKNKLPLSVAALLIAVILMGTGIVQGFLLIRESRSIVQEEQENNLSELSASVDRNIHNMIRKMQDELYYISTRTEFQKAEEKFLSTGQRADLWFWLRDNSLTLNKLVSAVIALDEGRTVLASHTDFREGFVNYESLGSEFAQLWTGPDGRYYMGFMFRSMARHLRYAALMDLTEYYRQAAGSDQGNHGEILLFSEKLDLLISSVNGQVRIDRLRDTQVQAANLTGVSLMRNYLRDPATSRKVYEYRDAGAGGRHVFASILPAAASENGIFTVAVITDYDTMVEPVTRTNMRLVVWLCVILLGVMLLSAGIFQLYRERRESALELAELQEKNESMAQLLEKTKEMEHIQRLEMMGTMTSGIAHEFNNLLTPIMGYSIMVLEKIPEEDTELSDNVIAIYNASRKAKEIIQRLSDISRKNATSRVVPISPDALIQRVLETSRPSRPKEVAVETDLHCQDVTILANETQMMQLFLNLIINAYHAMEEKGGKLTVRTSFNSFRQEVEFRIRDQGTGIPKEILPDIFEPFYTTKEAGKGSGLGLSIARNIVEEHHGSIDVDSVEGAGTEFIVCLPTSPDRVKEAGEGTGS